eukprot:CAMPEP_0114549294 /NCGR_PEP_ID=MMETSP0114-20121206/5451_1 /TAXON_ID=31324 /ORGANISM="Goniomonas sp, Strain m" /LENGTH=1069 /DNA_ID=CAMNT_0001733967 /DNA_START=18 /DNA_END=3226 /DNA_ORIENTATION=+
MPNTVVPVGDDSLPEARRDPTKDLVEDALGLMGAGGSLSLRPPLKQVFTTVQASVKLKSTAASALTATQRRAGRNADFEIGGGKVSVDSGVPTLNLKKTRSDKNLRAPQEPPPPTSISGRLVHKLKRVFGRPKPSVAVEAWGGDSDEEPLAGWNLFLARLYEFLGLLDPQTGRRRTSGAMHPDCAFMRLWSLIQALVLLYITAFLPVRICFSEEEIPCDPFVFKMELALDLYWFVDVALGFLVGSKGMALQIELDLHSVAWRYFQSNFWIDLIISVPVTWITFFWAGICGESTLEYLRLLRLLRLAKVAKMLKILKMYASQNKKAAIVMQLTKLFFGTGFLMHLAACGWWYVKSSDPQIDQWLEEQYLDPPHGTVDKYVASLYFAAATLTTVGYGDIFGKTTYERTYAMLLMMMGAGVFAAVISQVGSIVNAGVQKDQQYQDKMHEVANFVKAYGLPTDLAGRLRDVIHSNMQHEHQSAVMALLYEVPPQLRHDIVEHLAESLLGQVEMFQGGPLEYLSAIFMAMQPLRLGPNEPVYFQGDTGREMYLVYTGFVKVVTSKKQLVMGRGDTFGNAAVLFEEPIVRRDTAITTEYTELFVLFGPDLAVANNACASMKEKCRILRETELEALRNPSLSLKSFNAARPSPRASDSGALDDDNQESRHALRLLEDTLHSRRLSLANSGAGPLLSESPTISGKSSRVVSSTSIWGSSVLSPESAPKTASRQNCKLDLVNEMFKPPTSSGPTVQVSASALASLEAELHRLANAVNAAQLMSLAAAVDTVVGCAPGTRGLKGLVTTSVEEILFAATAAANSASQLRGGRPGPHGATPPSASSAAGPSAPLHSNLFVGSNDGPPEDLGQGVGLNLHSVSQLVTPPPSPPAAAPVRKNLSRLAPMPAVVEGRPSLNDPEHGAAPAPLGNHAPVTPAAPPLASPVTSRLEFLGNSSPHLVTSPVGKPDVSPPPSFRTSAGNTSGATAEPGALGKSSSPGWSPGPGGDMTTSTAFVVAGTLSPDTGTPQEQQRHGNGSERLDPIAVSPEPPDSMMLRRMPPACLSMAETLSPTKTPSPRNY